MDRITSAIVTIVTAIIGVAIIATLVSRNANTANVIQSAAQGLAGDLAAATAPVTGSGGFSPFMSGGYPID